MRTKRKRQRRRKGAARPVTDGGQRTTWGTAQNKKEEEAAAAAVVATEKATRVLTHANSGGDERDEVDGGKKRCAETKDAEKANVTDRPAGALVICKRWRRAEAN